MTIAISLLVNDGLVLAADSASTFVLGNTYKVYNNANKIFNLRKGLPIGAITWGLGGIGSSSISTHMKDLRRRFAGDDPDRPDWTIGEDYSLIAVAERVRSYFFDELCQQHIQAWTGVPPLGLMVGGYSSGQGVAEQYGIFISNGTCDPPAAITTPLTWRGDIEAVTRLILGFGTALPSVLEHQLNVPHDQIEPMLNVLRPALEAPIFMHAMPFQDAIELAEFLVDVASKYAHFLPGPQIVGGPAEVAAISKHEGFKWIRRKHYFTRELNPEVP